MVRRDKNSSRVGAHYEAAYRASLTKQPYAIRWWQPPRPRYHSTGFDSMSWLVWHDNGGFKGDLPAVTDAKLYEFKAGRLSCNAAAELSFRLNAYAPLPVVVVHRRKEKEFCEH